MAGGVGRARQAVQSHVTSETSDDGLMEAVFGVANQGRATEADIDPNPPDHPNAARTSPQTTYCARVDTVVPALLE